MKGKIEVYFDGKWLKLLVNRIYLSKQIERVSVTAKNKQLIFQGNRPLLRSSGFTKKAVHWQLIAGEMHNMELRDRIIAAIDHWVEKLDEPPKDPNAGISIYKNMVNGKYVGPPLKKPNDPEE